MGRPIALNLIKAGYRVKVWNRTPSKMQELVAHGGIAITELSQVTAPIVLTLLPDMKELQEVLKQGLQQALSRNSIVVVMGTTSPRAVKELSEELSSLGIHIVDAPVSGGDVGAQRGELSIMVGATEEHFLRLKHIFSKIGKTILHVGPIGSGQILKACNQLIVGANFVAIAEALTLARKSGISDENFYQIIAHGLAGSKTLDVKWEKLHSGEFTPGGKSLFQLRDLGIAEELATSLGLNLESLHTTLEKYQRLIDMGHGEIDHSGVIKAVE
jgi:2-hydroxy-3-oxopropionate reductase